MIDANYERPSNIEMALATNVVSMRETNLQRLAIILQLCYIAGEVHRATL